MFCAFSQSTEALNALADDLPPDSDPALLARCAEYFVQHGQYERAVRMMLGAKQYARALDMCVEHEVPITEVS